MEKTFNQIAAVADEPQTDVPQNQSTPDETLEAVANLNTILDRSKSPPNHSKVLFEFYFSMEFTYWLFIVTLF